MVIPLGDKKGMNLIDVSSGYFFNILRGDEKFEYNIAIVFLYILKCMLTNGSINRA
ncbi:MAG: hypothetical protein Hyperionvirus34_16 [Hyperionvirus sp.]|uniref:Uncharacterized protein n=1 Tax=Hyperionvirus sp. TaxID=2487770 RepID=A0A3G5AC28_9VIRU|nr:MAG: hypothetical protein Hyperionvirus34_16 [Hyperionvirus sp.]